MNIAGRVVGFGFILSLLVLVAVFVLLIVGRLELLLALLIGALALANLIP